MWKHHLPSGVEIMYANRRENVPFFFIIIFLWNVNNSMSIVFLGSDLLVISNEPLLLDILNFITRIISLPVHCV
jgi:hypothetical protein